MSYDAQQPAKSRTTMGHRHPDISRILARGLNFFGICWLLLDAVFTFIQGMKIFHTGGGFIINVFLALFLALSCSAAQKVLFETFVSAPKRDVVNNWWKSGIPGRAFVIILCFVVILLIHFSWTATNAGTGIGTKVFIIPNFGIHEIAPVVGYLSIMVGGAFIAFADEFMFLAAEFIKD